MAFNITCMNAECKYYYECMCQKNLEETRIVINKYGNCVSFDRGVCEYYKLSEEIPQVGDKS